MLLAGSANVDVTKHSDLCYPLAKHVRFGLRWTEVNDEIVKIKDVDLACCRGNRLPHGLKHTTTIYTERLFHILRHGLL